MLFRQTEVAEKKITNMCLKIMLYKMQQYIDNT